MSSETSLKLPVIDFTKPDLNPGSIEWDLVKGQVQQALQEHGCFEALFHKIPLELRQAIFGAIEELFDLPLQIKTSNFSEVPFHGYIGRNPQIPLFESMGIGDPHIMKKVESLTTTCWPQGNTSFRFIRFLLPNFSVLFR